MLQIDQILQKRYRIVRVLGQGGMGAVYLAQDLSLEISCVVKEMLPPPDPALVPNVLKQFQREAKVLAGLRHNGLPRVSNYFTEGDHYYLVMDLIEGRSLDKLIGAAGLPEAAILTIADQLLDVLAYIHGQGVLHRDIKPGNIIVQPDGRAILVDFGLVKVVSAGQSTRTLVSALTPQYAPPEQYTGGADQRSDLYSLAATLYQALSGHTPASATEQLAGMTLQPLREWPHLRGISPNTERVIMKALILNRDARYPNANAMRADLAGHQAIVERAATAPVTAPRVASSALSAAQVGKPRGNAGLVVAIAGVVAVVLLAIGAVAVSQALSALPPTRNAVTSSPPTSSPLAVSAIPAIAAGATPTAAEKTTLMLKPGVLIKLVSVPAGQFTMGSEKIETAASEAEKPQHKVQLDEYLIGRYDVTNAQYAVFAQATGRTFHIPAGKENHPVVQVSWDEAMAFCQWASRVSGRNVRLPSEARWEKAARGVKALTYPWGNTAPDSSRLNFNNSVGDTTPVGYYSPTGDSPYQVTDMAGNVWQWTSSLLKPYPYNADDGREDPSSRDERVLRGGSYADNAVLARSANRNASLPGYRSDAVGFRVVVLP
ncbi:MAG: SUMF1/EgtB/PvdO family nonheme iron enzyme [Chloroflexi bacterium]|nr:SUMF1/EgtB/PvdO family nonheme iron enzyme [Chloroflexota bacterium]MCL5274394.1 SUMF1/EgtB/PvdO family nonheme iron enzyme [Chloroflexota bacterium]